MKFLYFLEGMRLGFLDGFFSLVTRLGEETVFLVIALLFFWCINKREGYYILTVGLFGTVINQAMKLMFKIPRPWVMNPSFKPVEGSIEAATGYSFPSGHTQNATGTFGAIGRFNSKRIWAVAVSAIVIVLVAFSRMYLGVHTPLDVGVSLGIGLLLVIAFDLIFKSEDRFNKCMPYVIAVGVAISLGLLLYVLLMNKEGVDAHNLESGLKNACTLLGCTVGLIPMYCIDKRYIKFETKASWYVQLIKLVGGFLIVLGIKSGLSKPLTLLFGNAYVARSVRYCLIVLFAGTVWPYLFRYLTKIKLSALDRFGEWVSGLFRRKSKETE